MNRYFLYSFAALACFAALQPAACRADSLLIGQLSFDVTNPTTPTAAGTNTFDLLNLTGLNAFVVGSDAITDNESFSGTLTLVTSSSTTPIIKNFSGVDDSGMGEALISLSSTIDVYSATLTLTLSGTHGVNILNSLSNPVVADLQAVADTSLSPSVSPTALVACDGSDPCDQAAITVDTAPPVTGVTPEPETVWLVLSGLGGVAAFRRRFRAKG